MPIMILVTVGGVVAGIFLQGISLELGSIPGLLVLLPAILGMRGNISGALGSRLASALHLGLLKPSLEINEVTKTNFVASLTLNVSMSFLLGIVAHAVSIMMGGESAGVVALTSIALITGLLAGIALSLLTFYFAVMVYRRGLDPDNVLAPSLATVGDVFTIICLLIAVRIVQFGGLI